MTIDLQQAARDHLWLHFTRMGAYADAEVPIIVRGDGCHLEDANGKRYLDALAGLFAVQIGYSHGDEVGQAAHEQMRELPFYTNWSYAHPRAIELAHEVASLAPGDLNRVFFVSGGSEAVEAAWKLARQYHLARGERRWKVIGRRTAYHGTTMGALSINGIPGLKNTFEPLVPDTLHVRNTNRYHRPPERDRGAVHRVPARRPRAGDPRGRPRDRGDGDHGAGAELGRRVHAARRLLPGRAGDLRPVRDPALRRRGDHRLRPPRRLVRLRALRHPARPDHVREGALLGVRGDRRRDRLRPRLRAVPRRGGDVHARHHLRRPPGDVRDRAEEHRDHEARARDRERPRERGRVQGDAGAAARAGDRRRPARNRLLLRARAREGQGDARGLHARGVRDAAARLPLAHPVRARADLPRRRPRRPGDPDLAAARRRARASSTRSWASSARSCARRRSGSG